jgi:hypothetical protein
MISVVAGDVVLAQTIALEIDERVALAMANKFTPKRTSFSKPIGFEMAPGCCSQPMSAARPNAAHILPTPRRANLRHLK